MISHTPRISLEQWRTLLAVVDAGGYAQAAVRLHKSQSAVTYAVQKLESLLGVRVFAIEGRRARLTPTGQLLYRRASQLLDEAGSLERTAGSMSAGWEAEISLAVETIFPDWMLLSSLARFGQESPHTHIEVIESVLGGAPEALLEGRVGMAISPRVPPGFMGEALMRTRFIAVAHPEHALHGIDRALTLHDLRKHRHLVVRDSGSQRMSGTSFLESTRRWTVSHMATSIRAAAMGLGYAWFPEDKIREELKAGRLKPLKLRDGNERYEQLYLIIADRETAGPGTLRLAEILRESAASGQATLRTNADGPIPARRQLKAKSGTHT